MNTKGYRMKPNSGINAGNGLQVEHVILALLVPYARNAKQHSDEQVQQIADSIVEFGFNNPVLIDTDNGIIAGHGRVLAAALLGMVTVPCIRLEHLTDAQRRAYILADNRLAEIGGGWDEAMLVLELTELKDEDFDIELTGFSAADLNNLLHEELPEVEGQDNGEPKGFNVIAECEDADQQRMVFNLLTRNNISARIQ